MEPALGPPTQEGVSGRTDGLLTCTGHGSAGGRRAESSAQPVCSSVTMQEKVGLPGRGMKCGVRTYE